MRVGLFFGTFNPIHIGHLILANHMANLPELDQVWLVVTPQNPHKIKQSLLADHHRLALVQLAIEDNDKLRASDIEFKMPKPNYTVDTLAYLKEKFPKNKFSLIIGEDNLRTFNRWKNFEVIRDNYPMYVYPRVLTPQELTSELNQFNTNQLQTDFPNAHFCLDAPLMKISSTYIRDAIAAKEDVRYLLTKEVEQYIDEMNFYK